MNSWGMYSSATWEYHQQNEELDNIVDDIPTSVAKWGFNQQHFSY
jgi:hypothetical protein